jgi:multidrug efflux pump subunit AcrA (membrane-fusion protein)
MDVVFSKNKILKRGLSLILAVAFLFLFSKGLNAQEGELLTPTTAITISPLITEAATPSPSPDTSPTVVVTQEVQNVNTKEYNGTVTRIEGRTLTVDTNDGVKSINVPENVQIRKNGNEAQLEDIKVNDKISFAQSDNGDVISISATSGEVFDFAKYAIPIGVTALILLGLLYYLFKKSSRGRIRTSTEQVS